MESIKKITQLKSALHNLQNKGHDSANIELLQNYLSEIQKTANAENALKQFERESDAWKADLESSIEMFKAVIEAGLNALKTVLIINGTAAASLLAFIGGITEKNNITGKLISNTGHAMFVFIIGAGVAGVAFGLRYLSQASFHNAFEDSLKNKTSHWQKTGTFFNLCCILAATTSYITFFYGAWLAYQAIINSNP